MTAHGQRLVTQRTISSVGCRRHQKAGGDRSRAAVRAVALCSFLLGGTSAVGQSRFEDVRLSVDRHSESFMQGQNEGLTTPLYRVSLPSNKRLHPTAAELRMAAFATIRSGRRG